MQRFQVKPDEPDKEATYIGKNIQATRTAFGLEGTTRRRVQGQHHALAVPAQRRRGLEARHPAARPAAGLRHLRPAPAGPRLLQRPGRARRRPLHDRRQGARHGGRRPRAAPRRPARRPEEVGQREDRLHPRLRPDRRLRQPAERPGRAAVRQRRRAALRRGGPAAARPDQRHPAGQDLPRPDLLRREQPRLLDRRQGPRRQVRRARRPAGQRHSGPVQDQHLRRQGRRRRRQPLPQAALRHEVRRRQHRAVLAGQPEQQDPLRPLAARAGAEGRAVADRRLRRAALGRRRQDGLDPRRLHDHRQVPRLGEEVAAGDDLRRDQPALGLRHPADRPDQLHEQRGQGHGRHVRRHGQALRLGRSRTRSCARGRRPSPAS